MTQQFNEFRRSPEYYTTEDLCVYAREILLVDGEESGVAGRVRASWETDDVRVSLLSGNLDADRASYQLNVHDKTGIGQHELYMLQEGYPAPVAFDAQGVALAHSRPMELCAPLMGYLQTHPVAEEPQLDRLGTMIFRNIAARYAIETAVERRELDVTALTRMHTLPAPLSQQTMTHARQIVRSQHLAHDGVPYLFSRHDSLIERHILSLVMDIMHHQRSLPPSPPEISES